MADPREIAQRALDASLEAKRALAGAAALRLAELGAVWTRVLGAGGKILLCGNGGSAADAQHLAAELVGRYLRDRGALPAVALTVDTSILTAVANDYGYDAVFARQVEALGRKGDLLVALTTSGNSSNVLRAIEAAQARGLETMALTGAGGGQAAALADYCFTAPSDATPRIQECHILVGHVLCEIAEASRDD